MGCVKNITYNSFPRQRGDLGTIVRLGLDGKTVVPAVVVRSDAESPNRTVFRTLTGLYVSQSELGKFELPEQGIYLGRRTEVCFHYDTSRKLEGKIVRDDYGEPHLGFIHLEDGRVIGMSECQYSPLREESVDGERKSKTESEEIICIKQQLSRRNSLGKVKLLHGIYKQLVPSRKSNTSNGQYANKQIYQKEQHHFIKADSSKDSIEQIAHQIIRQVENQKFVGFLIDEMNKLPQLKDHVNRLVGEYLGPLRVDMLQDSSKPIEIRII